MQESVTVMEVRRRLGDILNRVDLLRTEYVVERRGRPLAVIAPVRRVERAGAGRRGRKQSADEKAYRAYYADPAARKAQAGISRDFLSVSRWPEDA